MTSITNALISLLPNVEFTLTDADDYSTIIWHSEDVDAPTEADIQNEIVRLEEEKIAKKIAAESKLAELGLSLDDLKTLLS
jgi:Zn-dependent M28 family amino/carboxypeptidase